MNTDHYFEQGHAHEVCQDYAVSGETDNIVYAVVADGCSESPKSDVGARIVAESFVRANGIVAQKYSGLEVDDGAYQLLIKNYTLEKMYNVGCELGLSLRTLDATLVAAVYVKSEKALRLFMYGDGHIAIKYKDGIEHYAGAYPHNAPFYLSYQLDVDRRANYIQQFIDPKVYITRTLEEGKTLTQLSVMQHESFYQKMRSIEEIEYVMVSSDGMDSYTIGNTDQPLNVFKDFTAFKSLAGSFVQRRMMRFRQETKAATNQHYDDISAAAISFK